LRYLLSFPTRRSSDLQGIPFEGLPQDFPRVLKAQGLYKTFIDHIFRNGIVQASTTGQQGDAIGFPKAQVSPEDLGDLVHFPISLDRKSTRLNSSHVKI